MTREALTADRRAGSPRLPVRMSSEGYVEFVDVVVPPREASADCH
jgi:hypothetical protein